MGILSIIEKVVSDPLGSLRILWAAAPLLKDVLAGGPAALEAFEKAAPDVWKHAQDLADALKKQSGDDEPATEEEAAVVAAHVAGVDPPGWVSDETKRWMDRVSGVPG